MVPGASDSRHGARLSPPQPAQASSHTLPPRRSPPRTVCPRTAPASVSLNAAIGEREGAWIVVTGATNVTASIDGAQLGPLKAGLFFGHFVTVGGRAVPDALLPWDGSATRPRSRTSRSTSRSSSRTTRSRAATGRPSTSAPTDERPTCRSRSGYSACACQRRMPRDGNLLTSFHVVPESYVSKVDALYHLGSNPARAAANEALYSFLAAYRISPAGWGFGEPRKPDGYTSSSKWWLDAAGNMVRENRIGFAAMRIPISNQRASRGNRIAGISPFALESWCGYLQSVRAFWDAARLAAEPDPVPLHARRAGAGGMQGSSHSRPRPATAASPALGCS